MKETWKYRGRLVTDADVAFIRELIAAHPSLSRRALSAKLCEAWSWLQPNGVARDMVCRGLMLALHRAGRIELPTQRRTPPNPLTRRRVPVELEIDRTPLRLDLRSLGPLRFQQVRRTAQEPLFNSLIQQHHYLGYTQPVGEHLKYLVSAQERPMACLAWSSAPRLLGCRDRFLGWSAEARRRNLPFIAYNLRFLILPWIEVPHLASHLLGRMARQLSAGLAAGVWTPIVLSRDVCGPAALPGRVLSCRQLDRGGPDDGSWKSRPDSSSQSAPQGSVGLSTVPAFSVLAVAMIHRPRGTNVTLDVHRETEAIPRIVGKQLGNAHDRALETWLS